MIAARALWLGHIYKLACVAAALVGLALAWQFLLFASFFGDPPGMVFVIPILAVAIWLGVQTVRRLPLNTPASYAGATLLGVFGAALASIGVLFAANPPGY